jgi:hypothetical protein
MARREIASLICLGIAIGFIIADLINNKNFSILAIILFVVVGAAYGVRYFLPKDYAKYFQNIKNIKTYYLVAGGTNLLVAFLMYYIHNIKRNRNLLLLKEGVFFDDSNFVAYISKSNHLVQSSKRLEDIFKKNQVKSQKGELLLKYFVVDGSELDPKFLEKAVINCNGKINEPVNFKFIYSNSLIVEMNIVKKAVLKGKKKCGYILVDNTITNSYKSTVNSEFKKNLYIYLDLFNEPLAYFDQDEKAYIASHSLLELLNLDNNRILKDDFKKLMHSDDISNYEKSTIELDKVNTINYRLNSKNGYIWFEESKASFFNNDFILMKKVDVTIASKVVFGNYNGLVKLVDSFCEQNKQFGLIVMNTTNIPKISGTMGKDFTEILLSKFFVKILNGPLKDQVNVFKIGSIEYVLVIERTEYLDLVIRDLDNKTSDLISQDIYINNSKYTVECELGIVASKDFEKPESRTIIKAAFDVLKEATDPDFLNDYSIYQPKAQITQEYSLADLGIDLEEDDLTIFDEDIDK